MDTDLEGLSTVAKSSRRNRGVDASPSDGGDSRPYPCCRGSDNDQSINMRHPELAIVGDARSFPSTGNNLPLCSVFPPPSVPICVHPWFQLPDLA